MPKNNTVKPEEIQESFAEKVVGSKKKSFLPKFRISAKFFFFVLLSLVAILGVAGAYYYYEKYEKAQKEVLGSVQEQDEVKILVEKVGKLMELPKESPTVATVSDVEKLRSQPFFDRARNGDKLLIYKSLNKAILYRPTVNKIIDVAIVNLETQPTLEVEDEGEDDASRVLILNGTTTVGLTEEAEELIGDEELEIGLIERDNAKRNDHSSTVVIDITGGNSDTAEKIAVALSGSVGSLPDGEEKTSDFDILVILGTDFSDR